MEKSNRILYLTFDFLEPIFSGNGTLSRLQVFGLLEKGFQVMVLCPKGEMDPQITKWIELGSLHIINVGIKSSKNLSPSCDWKGFLKIMDYLDEILLFGPQLIINSDWHTATVAISLKKKISIPLVCQFFRIFTYFKEYIENDSHYQIINQKEKEMVTQSDLIITLSKFDKKWCLDHGAQKVKVLYPPLMADFINALNDTQPGNVEETHLKLITISRLSPEKQIRRIFPLLKEFNKIGVNFTYTLIGEAVDSEYEKIIKNTVQTLDLGDKIKLMGRIALHEMIQQLRANSIYIHTSSYEPFGITIVEAAAAGCIVVLDRYGLIGAKELLELSSKKNIIVDIDFSKPKQSARILEEFVKTRERKNQKTIDSSFLSKLRVEHYMEILVKIFRAFL